MPNFEDRQKAFEAKYQLDQDLRFRVQNRRNKLVGLWAAEQMGLTGAEAETYARAVVSSDFDKPGDEDVLEKLTADLTAKGIDISNHRVRRKMDELLATAGEQIMNEIKA